MNNPANGIKDLMWAFLMDGHQEFGNEDIDALKENVYTLIQATTQKTAGQRGKAKEFNWDNLDMLMTMIACEATCLVLSGRIEELRK